MNEISIRLQGPLFFTGKAGPSVFQDELGKEQGVYLWTIPYKDGGHIVTYVGETGVSFAKRMREHMIQIMGGNYRFSDPEAMRNGDESVIWNGTWRKGTRDKMEEFLSRLPEFAPKIQHYLRSVSIFVGPIKVDVKTRRRIEGAIALCIRKSPEPYSSLYPWDNRYPLLKKGVPTFQLRVKTPLLLHGLKEEFEA